MIDRIISTEITTEDAKIDTNLRPDNFEDYIATVVELTDVDNFEYYYTEFRKFSCLNAYKEKGFDIKKFYDEDKSEESQLENLNQYSIEDN